MKKRLLLCFVTILFLAGCSMGGIEDADKIIINELQSFTEVIKDSSVTITDSDDIEAIIEGIENAKKQPGTANMVDPQFELVIGERKFFLWLMGQGTVMDQGDTHTAYLLSDGVREQFEEIILPEFE